LEIEELKKTFT